MEAPLVVAAAKEQKPLFPSGDLERTAAVFDALMGGSAARRAIHRPGFRQGGKVEPAIARVLASLARLGHVHSNDGPNFSPFAAAPD